MSAFSTTIQLIYVAAASCFVLGLHLMNNPATARRGNQVSTAGMVAAVVATLALIIHSGAITVTGWIVMAAGALVGAGVGLYSARTVQMTAMPQLVSVFNAVGGGAAALVGIHDYMSLADAGRGVPGSITVTTLLDVIIGAGHVPWLARRQPAARGSHARGLRIPDRHPEPARPAGRHRGGAGVRGVDGDADRRR